MRILMYCLIILAIIAIAATVFVRVAPVDAADWHVDPEDVTAPGSRNFALLAGAEALRIDAPALSVAGRVQAIAEAEGAQVLAGSVAEGHVTYIVRTRLMGFPDFISIRLVPEDEMTRLHIFSRSRYGESDFGVNTARVQRWLSAARGE
ncbi:MAG: DUF1499 domain-containing protein [Roseicyclus sp.]|nr:DUF1499 domain-containing protein [Roseicyclus sp.]